MKTHPANKTPQLGRGRLLLLSAIALLIAAGVVATLLTGHDEPKSGTGGHPDSLGHVHGLGVDPGDGVLYAATHSGLFRLPEKGGPERVSESRQDTMGFTVVAPGHFLGSGHPDPRIVDAPANLGLIESTDAGRTWQPLSLSGHVDFHGLEAKHGTVFGYSSTAGALMVSGDHTSWERLASVPLADFAVSPASPEHLLGTTEQGPVRSADGGRSFELIPNIPLLYLLDWSTPHQVNALDPQGRAFVSADGGTTWQPRGRLGSTPRALAIDGDRWYVATDDAVMVSADGGRTFQLRTHFH